MKTIEVVATRRWRNVRTGATASTFGAVPWVSTGEEAEWVVEYIGWSWKIVDSRGSATYGLGRLPVATKEEAMAIAQSIASRTGATIINKEA